MISNMLVVTKVGDEIKSKRECAVRYLRWKRWLLA